MVRAPRRAISILYIIHADISLLRFDYIEHALDIDETVTQRLSSLEDPLSRVFFLLAYHGI